MSTTTTKERAFNCTGDEVRAIRDGRMTMFRRPTPTQEPLRWNTIVLRGYGGWTDLHGNPRPSPFGVEGDRLYVRETWNIAHVSQLAPGEAVCMCDCYLDEEDYEFKDDEWEG